MKGCIDDILMEGVKMVGILCFFGFDSVVGFAGCTFVLRIGKVICHACSFLC